jgi:hypothetical protein
LPPMVSAAEDEPFRRDGLAARRLRGQSGLDNLVRQIEMLAVLTSPGGAAARPPSCAP